jgi:diguanylate cyclase (GGDEF)-like protein/PAS domain S-box-containing protein
MMTDAEAGATPVPKAVFLARNARWIAYFALASGLLILAGWTWHIPWLLGAIAGSTPTRANTAICIVLLSAATIVLSFDSLTIAQRRIIYGLAGVVLLIVLATIAEYAFGLRLGIDEAIFIDPDRVANPGRMGLNTAIALLMLALATLFVAREDDKLVTTAHYFATIAAVIAFLGMLGYAYAAVTFYQFEYTTGIAPATGIVLFALSGALLWASRDRGFMQVINSDNAAGFLIRRILPWLVILPVVLGWVLLQDEKRGYFDTLTGIDLLVTINVVTLALLIAINSSVLFRSENARTHLQERLRANLADIERQIAERTKELRDTTARLAMSEQRFTLAVDGSESGILDADLVAGTLFCSPQWKSTLGLSNADKIETAPELLALVHPDDRERAMALLFSHYKGETATFSTEVRMRHADGSYRWMLSRGQAVRDESGRAIRMVGSQTDITELKALQERLRSESIHDAMTGLYNRRHFEERLAGAARLAVRYGRRLSVCICDIDDFKQINDRFGHATGDRVLQTFADILRRETRAEDVVARYGGDEFCILSPEVNVEQAAVCAERIRSRLETMPFLSDDRQEFSVTASFGIAETTSTDAVEFIGAADRALYAAKGQGRNQLALAR